MLKRAVEEPLGHAAAIITDVLESAESNNLNFLLVLPVMVRVLSMNHFSFLCHPSHLSIEVRSSGFYFVFVILFLYP